MKITWRNGVAWALLAVAVAQYLLTAPMFLQQMAAARAPGYGSAAEDSVAFALAWLTGPIYIVGWAAVVEYLSRIASALQRERNTE